MIFPLGLAQLIPPGAESPASSVNQRPEKKFNVMECVIAMSNVFVCAPDVYRYIVAENPCLVSFVNTQGCIQELIASFLSLQVHLLGPQCCKAAMAIDDNCWPKIFPLNPLFPPEVKNYCATIVPLPLPLPPVIP
ncbi:hypothetical protein M9H77_00853 [Catharanthus roseus]|uniref:Uncharacterized protein n=1 Tax=Catharanthus roseus TaxID=4058 RepID=A0ACC0C3Z5_CATRO|nr:hypothetical protein M9H77_00853 [Catharanthus roseus]